MATEMITTVWPEWQVEQTLGKGSYGTVYKAVRNDSNLCSYAAIKVISIPTDPSELASLRSEGLTEEGTRTYFQGIVNDFVSEIRLMEALKGTQNIVSVEDYKVVEREGEIGWDIYIRMELLTPFNTYLVDKQMSEQEVLQLGVDICSALEICKRRQIVHRDIKPDNIFVNSFGDFKLGDF
ncbi:MAG: protein kinase [Oscillospiraceae bacterium]|nr:protein kinase [Oscillospiraceae bacterium]